MQEYRIVMQYKNQHGIFANGEIIDSGIIKNPQTILELGLRHIEQIEILKKIQDAILNKQSIFLKEDIDYCPKCSNKLSKNGVNKCSFNAVFTDHKIAVQRQLCNHCKWSSVPSVNSLLGAHMHPDLVKMHCEEASKGSYNKARENLNKIAQKKRPVNSTMTIHGVIEKVGNYISNHPNNDIVNTKAAEELIIQSDGGHIKTKDPENRSFEALTSVVYNPRNIIKHGDIERGEIIKKHCAASALDDGQQHIKIQTLIAAKKEGMTKETKLTAICDGASNCWSIIDHLKGHCKSITYILDWFHIGKKFKNTGDLGTVELNKLLDKAKWHLWHGNVDGFYKKIEKINLKINDAEVRKKLKNLRGYIENNEDKIGEYSFRKKYGLVFSSNIAESNVESLINQRCKGKQHMQWSREGAHPILQIRAASNSKDWEENWEQYVLGAYKKAA